MYSIGNNILYRTLFRGGNTLAQVSSVFNFLKDYNELSNPVITEIDKQKWIYKLSNIPQIKEVWSAYNSQNFNELKLLEVKRPILEPCPAPDELIIDWIDDNWKMLNIETIIYKDVIVKEIENKDGTITQIEEYFLNVEDRKGLFEEWIEKRNNWRTVEIPKEQGLNLYNNLFKLYSEIKKESESVELILGDGHIKWITNLRVIDHPVLLQRVQLEFNPEKPSFIIKCDELKTELYTPMLRVIPSINQTILSEIINEIEINSYHIADILNTSGLFERLINGIDENGKFVDTFESKHNGPVIMTEPILFLRKRTLGFSMFIEKIIEDIESKEDIKFPDFFENMIGNYIEHKDADIINENWNQSGIDKDILLTLPANNEQLNIIKFLNNYGAVLVQGPPGTGKTHTIANLIGHLLSQGNSVLVTSHTEKALTVLKDKVYKDRYDKDINLQSLCISLLSSSSQKKEMDNAINEIAVKSTSLNLAEAEKKIERLENERKELIDKSKKISQELLQIRSLEYKDIVFDNETISPIDAAKFINSGYCKFDYIPGDTSDDTVGLPLSKEELFDLYHSNQHISLEEDVLLSKELPALETLWDINKFKENVTSNFELEEELKEWQPKLILRNSIGQDIISDLLENADKINDSINSIEKYQLEIIDKTIKDRIYRTFWTLIFEEFDTLTKDYVEYRKVIFENNYSIPERVIIDGNIDILNEIINSGRKVPVTLVNGLTKPRWKKFRDDITNNNKTIENRIDYENVRLIIQYELHRIKVLNKFNKLLYDVSEKELLGVANFEEKADQLHKKIQSSLNWYEEKWLKFINELHGMSIDNFKFDEVTILNMDKPIESIKYLLNNVLILDLNKRLKFEFLNKHKDECNQYAFYLNKYKAHGGPFDELINAVKEKDISSYENAYRALLHVLEKKEIFQQRLALIERLKSVAPKWAFAIINKEELHGKSGLPDNIELAWKWRQLSNQINRIDSYDPNSMQKELCNINERLMQNARKLACEKAWYKKIKENTQVQNQAIEAWRTTIRQIGKATGKMAPMLQKKARELMPLCQTAIPVWIMPLNRVAENFDPQKNKFDVVIIDEASQADILALSALYIGKKVIIVGDDEQVSPETVGIKTEEITALIQQHLQGIKISHLFNGKTSIYDLAKASGFKPLMLSEHFRCLPEIIEFSNQLSYNGRIKPLRDATAVNIRPAMIEYRVPNAYRTPKKTNEIEAQHIASIICACVSDEAYKDKTIGVISLLGNEQAYEIDRLLQTNLDPKEYENRRIQCGTASQFQGDERDIIFLSVVEGPSEKGGPVRLLSEDGNYDINRKKYNVAASRARDQMWVVHSLNPEIDLKPEDIRLRLINHAINPVIDKNESKLKKAESDFEKKIMDSLLNQGYKVIPQWKVGSYRIDMVIEDGDKKVALECDGEKWHTQDDLPNDLKRQAILERLGWKFIRIRGSAYYRNPEDTMKWVYQELENYGIKPNYLSVNDLSSENSSNNFEIIVRIKRRAEQIRREWHGEEANFDMDYLESETESSAMDSLSKDEVIDTESLNNIKLNLCSTEDININSSRISTDYTLKSTNTGLFDVNNKLKDNNNSEDYECLQKERDENKTESNEDKDSNKIEAIIKTKARSLDKDNKSELFLNGDKSSTNSSNMLSNMKSEKPKKETINDLPLEMVPVTEFLKAEGLEYIDKRSKGGVLWVLVGKEAGKVLNQLSNSGVRFTFSEKGGKASHHQPAWYTNSDK